MLLPSPEDDVKIKVTARANAGDRTLGSKPRPDKRPGVEHAQQGVNKDLQMEKTVLTVLINSVVGLVTDSEAFQDTSLPFGVGGW